MHSNKTRALIVVSATIVGLLAGVVLRIGRLGIDGYRASVTLETIALDVVQAVVIAMFVTWTVTRSKGAKPTN